MYCNIESIITVLFNYLVMVEMLPFAIQQFIVLSFSHIYATFTMADAIAEITGAAARATNASTPGQLAMHTHTNTRRTSLHT